MSFDVEIIQNKIDSIDLKTDNIDNDYILYIVLNQISKIEKAKIDIDKSKFTPKNTCDYELALISKNNLNCSFYISVFDNKIDFQLNHGGEYLYLQSINNLSDASKLREAISDFLQSPIKEKIKYCKDKIVSAEYVVRHSIDSKSKPFHYKIILGSCFPWQKKKIETRVFEPWVKKS